MVSDLKDKLLKAKDDTTFFETIQDSYYDEINSDGQLARTLADMHNQRCINLIEIFMRLTSKTDVRNSYVIKQAFSEAIPHLEVDTQKLAKCINHLLEEFEQDTPAYPLLSALKKFCSVDAARAKELLNFALQGTSNGINILSVALEAGAACNETEFVNHAIRLLDHDLESVCLEAISALGNISFQDKEHVKSTLIALESMLEERQSDILLATLLKSMLYISSQSEDFENIFMSFTEKHLDHHGESYIYEASVALFMKHKLLTPPIESRLFEICSYSNPQSAQTINNIDLALSRVLKQGNLQDCVSFLENFFERSEFKLSIKAFNSFVHELHNNKDTYLATLITRWMLAKKLALGQFCFDLTQSVHGDCSFTYDSKLLSTNDGTCSFLAKKACGWFFVHPKTVMSLIESLVKEANELELAEIQRIVFNPLLISYPGSVKDYLTNLQQSSDAKLSAFAASILAEFSDYQASIDTALEITELRPSQSDQYTYWKHHQKIMDDSMKQARHHSFLSSLFGDNESVLLYGNKSIHYVHHGDGKTRQEMPLQQFKHSFELASMQNIDPHGLDDKLWHYRAEGCNS